MKKVLFFVMTLVASAFIVPNAFAAAPEYFADFESKGKEMFFANGTEITIEERTDGVDGALITWESGSRKVTANAYVFGGNHNSDTVLESSSITMNGGAVKNIFGGGLHKSYVKSTYVEINGGKVYGITGGGASSLLYDTDAPSYYAGEAKNSPTKVDTAIVVVNGGETAKAGYSTIFGGGEGISYTKEAYVEINGGTWDYVTAAGANGATDTAEVIVNDGEIAVLQGVNRGETKEVAMTLQGGSIDEVYAGGETRDATVTATFEESTIVLAANVDGSGAEIGSISTGTNGGKTEDAVDTTKLAYDEEIYDERLFANSGFADENITTVVILNFIGILGDAGGMFSSPVSIPKGTLFTEEEVEELLTAINEDLGDSGIEFKGFFADKEFEEEFDFAKAIEEDTDVYLVFAEKSEGEDTPTETPAEKNPETSDINMMALIIALLIGGTGLAFTIKNRKFN